MAKVKFDPKDFLLRKGELLAMGISGFILAILLIYGATKWTSAQDPAKTAQALASYAKTLTTAQALLKQEGSTLDDSEHHHESPRSIHELRDELARHLERVVAEEETRGSHGLVVGG